VAKSKVTKNKDNAITRYFRDTRAELRKVHWPTREESWNLTKIVVVVTVGMALVLGFLDYLFSITLKGIIAGSAVAIGAAVVVAVMGVLVAVILSRQAA
jgi:preprotein translocase subunit SecE